MARAPRKSPPKAPASATAPKAPARRRASPAQPAAAGKSIAVRMYRGILGDCFLLTATSADGARSHVLIDCGVLQSVPSGAELAQKLPDAVKAQPALAHLDQVAAGPERMAAIVADIRKTTGGVIDLVVITHEHYDHLSGFAFGQKLFQDMTFKEVWMAWTEDLADEKARELRGRFKQAKATLETAVKVGLALGLSDERLGMAEALTAFAGPAERAAGAAPAAADVRTTRDMIDFVRAKAPEGKTLFLSPGQVQDRTEQLGFKAYVLGPPRVDARLNKDTPSSGTAKEVYLTDSDEVAAVQAALDALQKSRPDVFGVAAPPASLAGSSDGSPFARPHLLGNTVEDHDDPRWQLKKLYEEKKEAFRRIEDEWMGGVEALALKMDSDTNNTSLALALELGDGQVLLFPGDAQVGNWLSWYDQSYPSSPEKDPKAVAIDDLLKRVVFYKVGHHGSHNATLKTLGLEKMTHPRLTAALPVVEAVAAIQGPGSKTPGRGWPMPFTELYTDLKLRTGERIVRGDGDPAMEQKAFAAKPGCASVRYEDAKTGGLWVELTFPIA